MGLGDKRLCRWDMVDKHGIIQETSNTVLSWVDGQQFSKGTNFQCFATTGDGCLVVASSNGKIHLYGKTSMRMGKLSFAWLALLITHVDVACDGKWIIGTTNTYHILITTVSSQTKMERQRQDFLGGWGTISQLWHCLSLMLWMHILLERISSMVASFLSKHYWSVFWYFNLCYMTFPCTCLLFIWLAE